MSAPLPMLPGQSRIAITGGTGHLGAALVHHLVSRGHPPTNVRVIYLPGSTTAAVDPIPGLDLHPADILDPDAAHTCIAGATHVFHVAGNTSFVPARRRAQWLVNVEGTRNICDACLASPSFVRLVHTGTVNVLGIPSPAGSLGDESTSPYHSPRRIHTFSSPAEALALADAVHERRAPDGWWKKLAVGYFDSKLAADELVARYVQEHGLPAVRVLPGTLFGPHDRLVGNGIYILQVRRNAIPAYVTSAGLPLTHVLDQAEGHVLAMERGSVGQRYILGGRSQDNLPLSQMLAIIADVLREQEPGRKVRTPRIPLPWTAAYAGAAAVELFSALLGRTPLLTRAAVLAGSFPSFYSSAKARRELGYDPQRSFRDAVADMTRDYRAAGLLDATQRTVDREKP
jgi:dihydroflavonol-4-reductase